MRMRICSRELYRVASLTGAVAAGKILFVTADYWVSVRNCLTGALYLSNGHFLHWQDHLENSFVTADCWVSVRALLVSHVKFL